ncbi:hypothetical protein YC2023_047476 [Brassica napus]
MDRLFPNPPREEILRPTYVIFDAEDFSIPDPLLLKKNNVTAIKEEGYRVLIEVKGYFGDKQTISQNFIFDQTVIVDSSLEILFGLTNLRRFGLKPTTTILETLFLQFEIPSPKVSLDPVKLNQVGLGVEVYICSHEKDLDHFNFTQLNRIPN